MNPIAAHLEQIAHLAKDASAAQKLSETIQATRKLAQDSQMTQLENELSAWQSKLAVILKEPVGRQGMAKHALYWAEKIRSLRGV